MLLYWWITNKERETVFIYATKSQRATWQSQRLRLCRAIKSQVWRGSKCEVGVGVWRCLRAEVTTTSSIGQTATAGESTTGRQARRRRPRWPDTRPGGPCATPTTTTRSFSRSPASVWWSAARPDVMSDSVQPSAPKRATNSSVNPQFRFRTFNKQQKNQFWK